MTTPPESTPKYVFFRGKLVPYEDAKVSVLTHGLNYGTGCFERIRGYWNEDRKQLYLLKMPPHFERIHQSARILHMKLPYSVSELCDLCGNREVGSVRHCTSGG